ncbi:ankyrin repeat domain-containing protein [Acholeplasma granularum]|uniref:ankyrin repeat domain-containing protein n=1 Tax=Acholeplasma granularum TaxID=264635 RepID=UPI0004ACD579|nr:ankyrin repeat domain-containing protein [Acholeplasma granularum]
MDLFKYAFNNDVSSLQASIDHINIKDQRGKTLLHHAVLGSANDVIDYLLNQDIDINIVDQMGESAIFDCARKAKLNIAKKLLAKFAKVDLKNNKEETLLHLAAHKGNLDMIQLLVEHGGNLMSLTLEDKLPIHYAILAGHLAVVDYMMENSKLSYFHLDSHKNSFLHYATRTTNIQLIEYFINQKLDTNLLNDYFETPLFNAVRFSTKEVILLLLKYDAYIDIMNRRYETPYILAKLDRNDDITDLLNEWKKSPYYTKLITEQSLTIAVLNRDDKKLRHLIESGQKLKKDRYKKDAFDYATFYKLTPYINLLRVFIDTR